MQTVAVILALAVLAGCDARAVHPAADTWVVNINNFFEKMLEISQPTTEMVQNIQTSQFRTELDKAIADSLAEMAKYKDNVQAKFRPLSESTSTQIANDIQLLVDRLARDLQEGKERGLRYLNDMKFAMDQNTGDIQSQMAAYLRKLRKRLHSDTEEIRNTVATYMGELQSRATQNMDAAREQVQPYVHDTIDNAGEKMTQVSTALRNQAEDLGRQLESQAEVLRSNLEATGQEMRTFIEGVMESLNAELPSIASQVREKLEDIVDKVQKTASA